MQPKSLHKLGAVIFFIGILLALSLSLAAVWSDFEGVSYFYTGAGYPSFSGLNCPILMTHSETGMVSASFNNSEELEIEPYYEVTISGQSAQREFEGQLSVPAHSSKTIRWTVNADDIDLGYFIFINMEVLPVAGHSTRADTCGIIVLNLAGLTGDQVSLFTLSSALSGILIGFGIFENTSKRNITRSSNRLRAMQTLGIMVLLALLASMLGLWLPGILFIVLTILLLVIILRLFVEG